VADRLDSSMTATQATTGNCVGAIDCVGVIVKDGSIEVVGCEDGLPEGTAVIDGVDDGIFDSDGVVEGVFDG